VDSTANPALMSPNTAAPAVTPTPPRTWLRRIHGGGAIAETCPEWCTATHANDQDSCVDDLTHDSPAVAMRIAMQVEGTDGPAAWPVLSAMIRQWPYESDGDTPRQPYISFEPSADEVVELDADGLALVIAEIRAHANRLERLRTQLVEIVAEHDAGAAL
jgi:hypothetical protein